MEDRVIFDMIVRLIKVCHWVDDSLAGYIGGGGMGLVGMDGLRLVVLILTMYVLPRPISDGRGRASKAEFERVSNSRDGGSWCSVGPPLGGYLSFPDDGWMASMSFFFFFFFCCGDSSAVKMEEGWWDASVLLLRCVDPVLDSSFPETRHRIHMK